MLAAVGICVSLASTEVDARLVVDQIRRDHGLPAVKPNPALQQAAESHVLYMVANETAGHSQTPDGRGYTGRTPGDRARHFGYVGANSEAVGWGDLGAREMMRGLFEAPYHRVLFLQPSAPDFGSAFADGAMCLKFGGASGSGAVVSPPNGAHGVRAFWDGIEAPDPLRSTNLRGPVGYPIVLAVFGREADQFRSIDARIVGPNGRVQAIVLTPATDKHADDTVIVIPHKPLLPATTYTVTFNYANAGGEKTARTTFATAR
jgi:hypothetical protein